MCDTSIPCAVSCGLALMKCRNPSPELPNGWFDWIKPFFAITDDYVLNNCSLDGFFFLRFLRVLSVVCFVGCALTWPILLPVNGTGGSGLGSLEVLTIGNVAGSGRLYVHAFVAWAFFGTLFAGWGRAFAD